MFGHNEIVGKKDFNDPDKLMVTSTFKTLQGEGPYSGLPAVFVRLAKCNLACSFCDTYFDNGDWFTIDELGSRIHDHVWDGPITKNSYVLVLTGGEPMLQKALVPFLESQAGLWRAMQIESNGIIPQPIPSETTLVVSPKCIEKNGVATRYLKPHPEVLKRANALKFVMCDDLDSPYSDIPIWAYEWRSLTGGEIYVSPMNIYAQEPAKAKAMRNSNEVTIDQRSDVEEVISFWTPGLLDLDANQRNHEFTAQYAISNGLRFQLQAHLYASVA